MARKFKVVAAQYERLIVELLSKKRTHFAACLSADQKQQTSSFYKAFKDHLLLMTRENPASEPTAIWHHFEDLAKACEDVELALDALLKRLVAPDVTSKDRLFEELWRLHSIRATRSKLPVTDDIAGTMATQDLEAISVVTNLASNLKELSVTLRVEYAALAKSPTNQGSPRKRRFTYVCLEAWMALAGKRPSHGSVKFANFLNQLWLELFPTTSADEDWTHTVRLVGKSFREQQIENLGRRGPDWFPVCADRKENHTASMSPK